MKESWRKLGEIEGQKWKNWRARRGWFRDLRISEASAGVREMERELRKSARSEKGSDDADGNWRRRMRVALQTRSRRGRG